MFYREISMPFLFDTGWMKGDVDVNGHEIRKVQQNNEKSRKTPPLLFWLITIFLFQTSPPQT